jgi:hypothetical protein
MLLRAQKIFALIVLLALVAAIFYVESGHARARFSSRAPRPAHAGENSGASRDERKTLKRAMDIDDESALSQTARTPSRNLTPKEKRFEVVFGQIAPVSTPRLIAAPKVPTNIFLSVWNL